jgi:hypothetical protein
VLKPEFEKIVSIILFGAKPEFVGHVTLSKIPKCKIILLEVLCEEYKL